MSSKFLETGRGQCFRFVLVGFFCTLGVARAGYDAGYGHLVAPAFALLALFAPVVDKPFSFLQKAGSIVPLPYHPGEGEELESVSLEQEIRDREAQYKASSSLVCNEFGIWLRLGRVGDGLADIHDPEHTTVGWPSGEGSDVAPVPGLALAWGVAAIAECDWKALASDLEENLQVPALPNPGHDGLGADFLVSCNNTFTYEGHKLVSTNNEHIEDFQCQICYEIAVDDSPHCLSGCEKHHTLCKSCLDLFDRQQIQPGGTMICPTCNQAGEPRPNLALKNRFMQQVKVKCPKKCGGEYFVYDLFSHHLERCTEHDDCPFCHKPVVVEMLEFHKNLCRGERAFETVNCLHCNQDMVIERVPGHKAHSLGQGQASGVEEHGIIRALETMMDSIGQIQKMLRIDVPDSCPPPVQVRKPNFIEGNTVKVGGLELLTMPKFSVSAEDPIQCWVCINDLKYKAGCFFSVNLSMDWNCSVVAVRTFRLQHEKSQHELAIKYGRGALTFHHRFFGSSNWYSEQTILLIHWKCLLLMLSRHKSGDMIDKSFEYTPQKLTSRQGDTEFMEKIHTLALAEVIMKGIQEDGCVYLYFELHALGSEKR